MTRPPGPEILPRHEPGIDWGAERVVLARDGDRMLWWRRSCSGGTDWRGTRHHGPGELTLVTPDTRSRLPRQYVLHAGGRLSRALLDSFAREIDDFFGKPVTAHLDPCRTVDASTACRYCGRPRDVPARVAEENPFCADCLPERIASRARRRPIKDARS